MIHSARLTYPGAQVPSARWTLRRLADVAGVSKDLVYRLDAGVARYLDLDALERLCATLLCRPEEILAWENNGASSSPDKDAV
ncbi:MAG TPA: helix-turn-helix transcriptional regulator [Anaerolineae bacterium]|nr:helix-turn-helix transcriptional regulator [Anaerolineae bacterium]